MSPRSIGSITRGGLRRHFFQVIMRTERTDVSRRKGQWSAPGVSAEEEETREA